MEVRKQGWKWDGRKDASEEGKKEAGTEGKKEESK